MIGTSQKSSSQSVYFVVNWSFCIHFAPLKIRYPKVWSVADNSVTLLHLWAKYLLSSELSTDFITTLAFWTCERFSIDSTMNNMEMHGLRGPSHEIVVHDFNLLLDIGWPLGFRPRRRCTGMPKLFTAKKFFFINSPFIIFELTWDVNYCSSTNRSGAIRKMGVS